MINQKLIFFLIVFSIFFEIGFDYLIKICDLGIKKKKLFLNET